METASWVRRALALMVDWFASTLVVIFVLGADNWGGFSVLGVYVLESAFLTALAGGSFGKLATRLRVIRADGSGRPLDLLRALLRQALVALVVPPLIFRPDGRGLHDVAAGTMTVRLASLARPADSG